MESEGKTSSYSAALIRVEFNCRSAIAGDESIYSIL